MSMRYAAARLRGQRHQLENLPCQDWAQGGGRGAVTAAVLCDGAGSCSRSDLAARHVCGWALDFVLEGFETIWRDGAANRLLADRGREALERAGLGGVLCTLLLFACHQDGRWLAAHIGDGYIFLREAGTVRVLSCPENGDFDNETYFLCEPDGADHLRVYRGRAEGELQALLTSDGCGDSLYDYAAQAPAPAVGVMCSWLAGHGGEVVSRALARHLEELFSIQSDDDLSIALVHWAENDRGVVEKYNKGAVQDGEVVL